MHNLGLPSTHNTTAITQVIPTFDIQFCLQGMGPMNQMLGGSPGILNGYPGAVGPSGSPYQMQGGYYGSRSNVVCSGFIYLVHATEARA